MKTDWVEERKHLIDIAMGRTKADVVIRNGQWVNVQSGEIIAGTDIAIGGERIAFVGPDASHSIGDKTEVVDAGGKFLCDHGKGQKNEKDERKQKLFHGE